MNTYRTGYTIDYYADEFGPAYHAGPFWYRTEKDRDQAAVIARRNGNVTLVIR